MSRRRATPRNERDDGPEQLPLVASVKARPGMTPEQAAKVAIARRAKPASRADHVKLVLTLDLRRALAERLSARAIREGRNLEGVVIDIPGGRGEMMTNSDRAERALLLLQHARELLHECRAVAQQLERAPDHESQAAAAERIAYGVLVAALEEGLVTTLQHAMDVLQRFSTPAGPLGEEWLREQERGLGTGKDQIKREPDSRRDQ